VQVSVTFRHMDSSEPLAEYATDKVSKVTAKYLKNAQEAHVILSVNKHRQLAEINIHATRFSITAHDSQDDLYAAIDKAIAKVESQLRKHSQKLNRSKARADVTSEFEPITVEVIESESDRGEAPGTPKVVATEAIPAKPLSLEDAIFQLELNNSEFLVFRDASSEQIQVIYKRRDGNYGLIAPNA